MFERKFIHYSLNGPSSKWYFSTYRLRSSRTFADFREALYERFDEPINEVDIILKVAKIKYVGKGDVLAHVDYINTLLKRINATEEHHVSAIKNSLPMEMQRMIILCAEPKTVSRIVSLLKKVFPEHCRTRTD